MNIITGCFNTVVGHTNNDILGATLWSDPATAIMQICQQHPWKLQLLQVVANTQVYDGIVPIGFNTQYGFDNTAINYCNTQL